MRWFSLIMLVVVVGCGASSNRDISNRIARETPREWQENTGLQPWLEDRAEEEPPIARLAPEWTNDGGQPNLPFFKGDHSPIAGDDENPY